MLIDDMSGEPPPIAVYDHREILVHGRAASQYNRTHMVRVIASNRIRNIFHWVRVVWSGKMVLFNVSAAYWACAPWALELVEMAKAQMRAHLSDHQRTGEHGE